jgi:hypothetical protein
MPSRPRPVLAVLAVLAVASAACGERRATRDLHNLEQVPVEAALPAPLATVAAELPMARDFEYRVRVYGSTGEPGRVVTATLMAFTGKAGALAMYNGWFARFGFLPAVERRVLEIGDQAELFELGWPALHVALAREGELLAFAEAGPGVAPAERAGLLAAALAEGLAAGLGTPASTPPP